MRSLRTGNTRLLRAMEGGLPMASIFFSWPVEMEEGTSGLYANNKIFPWLRNRDPDPTNCRFGKLRFTCFQFGRKKDLHPWR